MDMLRRWRCGLTPAVPPQAVTWGEDARTLFVGASDHNLRVYGIPTADAMDAE